MQRIKSTCIFCGMGCRLNYCVESNKIVEILPDRDDPVSRGIPCPKGLAIDTLNPKRVENPLVKSKSGFDKVKWAYAIELIKDKIEEVGADQTGWVGSGEITNEDNYLTAKFARSIGSGNIDSSARLCHSPTVDVYEQMLGIPASPGNLDDILKLDTLLLVGTNPFSTYPVMFHRIEKAKSKGMKLIVINPFEDETSRFADVKVHLRPDYLPFFLLEILKILTKKISSNISGFDKLKKSLKNYKMNFEGTSQIAKVILESKKFGVAHGMGVTQVYNGLDSIRALVSIALLKKGVVLTNRGKINIQGAGDVGIYPDNRTLVEFLLLNPVKFVFSSIFNPVVSMPNSDVVKKNLRKIFFVHATPYFNDSSKFANLILPTPILYERFGTITTGESRVRVVNQVLNPPKNSMQEWEIFNKLGNLGYKNVKEVTREIISKIKRYSRIDVEKVYSGIDQFANKKVKPQFVEIKPKLRKFKRKFVLLTWRNLFQFNTGDLTNTSKVLNSEFNSKVVLINEFDAEKLGLKDGDCASIESDVGKLKARVKIGKVSRGLLVADFHFSSFPINKLSVELFNESMTPSFKTVPVDVILLS